MAELKKASSARSPSPLEVLVKVIEEDDQTEALHGPRTKWALEFTFVSAGMRSAFYVAEPYKYYLEDWRELAQGRGDGLWAGAHAQIEVEADTYVFSTYGTDRISMLSVTAVPIAAVSEELSEALDRAESLGLDFYSGMKWPALPKKVD